MELLLDTQVLVWAAAGAPLSRAATAAVEDPDNNILISAVTAWEYSDLLGRSRLPVRVPVGEIANQLNAAVIDYPAESWHLAALLPRLHADPVDRMLIAHAMHSDLTLVTSDKTIRDYPVRTLW